MTLGKRLAFLRQSKNLTQTELAGLTFISRSRLALYETDRREPDLQTLKQLSKFFNVSIDHLLDNDTLADRDEISRAAFDLYRRLQNVPPESRRAVEILLGLEVQPSADSVNKKAN